ncbi:uncharacterized protein EURHEDRAFT_416651 [Aspergillus ruber CBS 135680]|uniref:Uncharacterized protein n=1 Tax=Aspergillus ruber (strain CBS 135680) TaxID=1388766 RepID=A0A017S3K0_ASPRC|nr:uncharacterized protein EURHEDRAFT_416651 [Aspergillus ruber CBS 135680]EYE91209.1 hypothetical protein EURHEDRAFT_416651 [Aspergillus ruber CBS 135680]
MAYYDRHYYPPRDRNPPPYQGTMDVVPGRGSHDSIPRSEHPSNYDYYGGYGHSNGSGYAHGYPPTHSRHPSRVATIQEGSRRPHSSYYDGYDDRGHHRRHRHHRPKNDYYDDRGRSHRHRKAYSVSPSPSRGRSRSRARGSKKSTRSKSEEKMQQAIRAAITAGAIEAFRVRNEPGEWKGEKGKRILTAAITAGGADGLVDKDPRKHEKRHIIESTLAGLATNHFVNGSRSRSRPRSRDGGHGHRRGRSKSHNRGKELAAAGLVAAAGKKAYDRYRSKSRPRGSGGGGRSPSRGRAYSDEDGYDSYDGSPRPSRGSKKRSKSVSDYISKGLASLGIEDSKDNDSQSHRGSDRDGRDHDRRRRHHHHRRRSSPPPSDGSYSDDSGTASDDSRRR